jgi:hypothetical protein
MTVFIVSLLLLIWYYKLNYRRDGRQLEIVTGRGSPQGKIFSTATGPEPLRCFDQAESAGRTLIGSSTLNPRHRRV